MTLWEPAVTKRPLLEWGISLKSEKLDSLM